MESNRDTDGNLTPLARKNIDTGLGLERMAQILQQVPNNYETDLILPIVSKAAQLAGLQYASASASDKTDLKVTVLSPGCIWRLFCMLHCSKEGQMLLAMHHVPACMYACMHTILSLLTDLSWHLPYSTVWSGQ